MIKRACLLSILAVAAAVTMSSCGGGGGSAPITVSITTDVSNIETFQTVQFAAAVTGTSNTAVTWQLTCNTLPVSVCGYDVRQRHVRRAEHRADARER